MALSLDDINSVPVEGVEGIVALDVVVRVWLVDGGKWHTGSGGDGRSETGVVGGEAGSRRGWWSGWGA